MIPYLVLLLGTLCAATAPFLIKATVPLGPASLACVRLLLAAAMLAPFTRGPLRDRGRRFGRDDLIASLPGAILFALHQATWAYGVQHTTAVLSTIIINLNTVLLPFFVFLVMRERIRLGEAIGSAIGLSGVVWLVAVGKDPSGVTTPLGTGVCILSIAFCAAYYTMGRRFGRGRHIVVYIVPLYAIGGLALLAYVLIVREPLPHPITPHLAGAVLLAALIPTVGGHTAMNYAIARLPPQTVSMTGPAQVVIVALAAVPLLGERPGWQIVPPAIVVIAGVAIVVRSAPRVVRREIERASLEPPGT